MAATTGKRRDLLFPVLLLAGVLTGAALGYGAALWIALDHDRARLRDYGQMLEERMERVVAEARRVFDVVERARLDMCSDTELALLRTQDYRVRYIKDIGRLRDGFLLCTATAGRLEHPYDTRGDRMLMTAEGVTIAVNVPLVTAPGTRAMVVQAGDVHVVVDLQLYDDLVRPPLIGAFSVLDRHGGIYGPGTYLGTFQALDYREGRTFLLPERFVLAGCVRDTSLCYVGSLDRGPLLRDRLVLTVALLLGGGGFGASGVLLGRDLLRRQQALHRRLRRALRKGDVQVVYQPVVRLADRRLVAAEALVRWSPGGQPMQPDLFVAEAEAHGFIADLTLYVLARAMMDLGARLHRRGFRVTINIAASDLADERFFAALGSAVGRAALTPDAIGIELTERSTADRAMISVGLDRLHRAGYRIYLDDFGTGYSALSYLDQLPIDVIKVDKSFTDTVGSGSARASLVPQIMDMARHLGTEVVVEGIETEEQAAYLATHGAQYGQGYLFARPMAAAALLRLLDTDAPL